MSDIGWIKLHRQIRDSALWHSEPFSKAQAWIDLLLCMNHENNKIFFENKLIEIKRGQHITSYRKLSVEWKWSIGKVKRFIECLQSDNMINVEHFKNGTLLTVVNYEVYQGMRNTNGTPIDTPIDTQTEHQRNTDGTLIDTQTETNKNDKNDKNDKEDKNNNPPISPQGEKRKTAVSIIESRNLTKEVEDIVKDWVAYKTERREGYKPRGLEACITEIQNNIDKYGIEEVKNVINKTMSANYQGIVWDWLTDKKTKGKIDNSDVERWINNDKK